MGEERVRLNVGGRVFETTAATLRSGGPESLLSALSHRRSGDPSPIFIDRDPEIFSILLSLLRSRRLPSAAATTFSALELSDEAQYYGIDPILKSATNPPRLFGPDAAISATILPSSDPTATAFSAAESGDLWIAHGGQISSYDNSLAVTATIRTHLEHIDPIARVWPGIAAVGSKSTAGLHIYDLSAGRHAGSAHWSDPADPRIYRAVVAAIADSPESAIAAFECPHRENSILEIDKSTLQIKSEMARQSGSSIKQTVPGKLTWMPDKGVVVGSAVTCGAFGYAGYIRIWDPRSRAVVWETNDPGSGRSSRFGDSFADVDVDVEESKLYKICSKSGDLGMADMRKLSEDPWVYLEDKNPTSGGGNSNSNLVIHCYRKQVFVGRGGELEVWSRCVSGGSSENDVELHKRVYVDKVEDSERGVIRSIEGGGERLFVSRDGVEGVEVWESSNFANPISVSSNSIM